MRIHGEHGSRRVEHDCAIAGRILERCHADLAACSRAVFNDHIGGINAAQLLAHAACESIGRAARRETNDDSEGVDFLRESGGGEGCEAKCCSSGLGELTASGHNGCFLG